LSRNLSSKVKKVEQLPRRSCFLTIETDDEEGYGPFKVRSSGVSPQMLVVLRRAIADLENELLGMIQNNKE